MLEVANNKVAIFEAKTLEEVYEKASASLNCSITHLEIEITQAPSKGILGFFAKNAIISVKIRNQYLKNETRSFKSNSKKSQKIETLASRLSSLNEEKRLKESQIPAMVKQTPKEKLFEDFYVSKEEGVHSLDILNEENIILKNEIFQDINHLFSKLHYEINEIKVDIIDNGQTVYIEFSGTDSALIIGKEGYRYKALSYILFNWINEKYGMMLRLEVAQFLANQESAIYAYLDPVIETIKSEGFFKTKILDGILIHIALTKLREEFPDKYVAVKTTQKGEKYILINEYKN